MSFLKSLNLITIIPILISIFSLIISIITAFRSWWVERFNLDFEMIKWFGCSQDAPFFLWLSVNNKSKLPCSILSVELHNKSNNKNIYATGNGNKKLMVTLTHKTGSTITGVDKTYSLDYPMNIEAYHCIGGYFHVVSNEPFYNFEDDIIEVTIKTNRGSKTKKIYMDYGKNLYRVEQHKHINSSITTHSDGSPINYLLDEDI